MEKNEMHLRQRWFLPFLIVMLLAAGCGDEGAATATPSPTESAGAETDSVTATPSPSPAAADPTVVPSPTPTLEVATPTPSETPVSPPVAALRASEILASRLGITVDAVEIASTEPVTWPDGCLEAATGNEACTEAEVPGYRIVLRVDDAEYVYHTDESGDVALLGDAPPVEIDEPLLTWQSPAQETCRSATFGAEQMVTGFCGGPRLPVVYPTEQDRRLLVNDFAPMFAPFTAETGAGTVTFFGSGDAEAAPAQQRRIAEWARLNAAGLSTTSTGAVIIFRREIDATCALFAVDALGQTALSGCPGEEAGQAVRGALQGEQLDQFYGWLDQFGVIEIPVPAEDGAEATLGFYGRGDVTTFDEEALAAVQALIAQESAALAAAGNGEAGAGDRAYIVPVGWSRVLLEEVGLSFERPTNWSAGLDDRTWYANEAETLAVGVQWNAADTAPTAFFPAGFTVADQQPIALGWGAGTRYELDGPGGAAALHVLVAGPSGEVVYDFFATAPSADALEQLLPPLSRMVAAVTVTDESQGIAGPVQVTVDFLAAWLRDENSAESTALLTQSLQEEATGGRDIAEVLGVPAGYQSFSVSWLSTRQGLSRVQVDLTYADSVRSYVFTLLQVDDQWRIDQAAPQGSASFGSIS